MHPEHRRRFNAAYTDTRYHNYVRRLESGSGAVGFRLAETPVFFEDALVRRCEVAAREIVAQLGEPARLQRMRAAVPERFACEDASALPQFAVVDFAIARDARGTLVPRVVELQGFPSLYAFEALQRDAWAAELADVFPGVAWSAWYSDFDRDAYVDLLRRTIVGRCDPQTVVLLDIEPALQKTVCDFTATQALFGVEASDPRALVRRGTKLFRRDAANREVPVERIYNRLVGDDLARIAPLLPFDLRDDIACVWAPHPRWFWQWSKASLPFLDHEAVPRTRLLSELEELPPDLEAYVLKPLFSFAGGGVDIHPTPQACAAIAGAERSAWCLQEKITYAGALPALDASPVKVELRVMFLRPDGEDALVPATNLTRLSRGDMHGVDHNKDLTWVGSSIGLWESRTAEHGGAVANP
jgi:hypothetical protein